MRFFVAMVFFVHGFAHTVGFVVPWKIATLEDAPYKTTVFRGKIDLGSTGIRMVGLLWLVSALAFFAAGALVIGRSTIWQPFAMSVSIFSLALCVLDLPESRIGIPVNIGIVAFILLGGVFGWLGTL